MATKAKMQARSKRSASNAKATGKKTAGAPAKATTKKKKAARVSSITKKRVNGKKSSAVKTVKKKAAAKSRKVKKTTAKAKKRVGALLKAKKSINRYAPPATSHDPIRFPEERVTVPKTYLTHDELREFRMLLLRKRSELAGDVQHLSDSVINSKGNGGGDCSSMPIHMADLGSDNWEQEFTLGLIANEQDRMREIDASLARIADKSYGICLATRKRISRARLRAKPWAKYCIDYARAREEGRAL